MNRRRYTAIALALLATQVNAEQTLVAQVNGMVCAFCAQGIEKKLRSRPQTHDVYVNLGRRVVALEFKDGQSIAADDFAAIIRDAGYDVRSTETVDKSAARIKEELAKK